MATKTKLRTSSKSKRSNDMTTTYFLVGILVFLVLVLLYNMSGSTPAPTTTTEPSLVDSVINSVSSLFDSETTTPATEGFTDASAEYDPKKEVLIVFCKMNTCGHCISFEKNVWKAVEAQLNGKKNNAGKTIKMITVSPDHKLCSDVRGFPTIKKFTNDATNYVTFEGTRDVDTFKAFCMK